MSPRLRVLAGPSPDSLVPITDFVNTTTPYTIVSDLFEGQVVVNVQGFTDKDGKERESSYFSREDRQDITWSIQMQGRFLKQYSADAILFGNTFDRPLKLPWGSAAALKFMKYVDPTLDHDLLSSTKPWALSPLIATMPHFAHKRNRTPLHSPSSSIDSLDLIPESDHPMKSVSGHFPPLLSMTDYTDDLPLALVPSGSSSGSGSPSPPQQYSPPSSRSSSRSSTRSHQSSSSKGSIWSRKSSPENSLHFSSAAQRRSYFSTTKHRKRLEFGPQDVITTDFCYGFLEFNPVLALRLPGGISFDLARYWDGQPVRFICCERGDGSHAGGVPWGRSFWCVTIELYEE